MNLMNQVFITMAKWDVDSALKNGLLKFKGWGDYLIMILGVILIIYSVYRFYKAVHTDGPQEGKWLKPILALLFGGLFLFGGFKMMGTIAEGGNDTIKKWGSSGVIYLQTFMPRLFLR